MLGLSGADDLARRGVSVSVNGNRRKRWPTDDEPVTDEEIYDVERWLDRVYQKPPHLSGNGGVARRHIRRLIGKIRELQAELIRLESEARRGTTA